MPTLPSTLDALRGRLPIRRFLVAILAYVAVVTSQFARFQPRLDEFPPGFGTMIANDPDASLPVQYLEYLVGAAIGDWGISIYYARPVGELLVHSLPWLALVVVIAIVAAAAGVALQARFVPVGVPTGAIGYAVYTVAFLAAVSLLVGGRGPPGDFFLTTAGQVRDYPLALAARRLLALGHLVGALVLGGRVLDRVETSTAEMTGNEGSAVSESTT